MAFTRNYLHLLLAACVALLYSIKSVSFRGGKPTCDNFIVNVYLYLTMSIVVVGLSCYGYNYLLNSPGQRNVYLPHNKVYQDMWGYIIGALLACFALVIYLATSASFDNTNFKTVHAAWLAFLVLISISVYPYFKSAIFKDVVENALLITGTIFVVMTSIAFAMPQFFEKSYNFMTASILISLIAIILVEVYNILFNSEPKSMLTTFRMTSYAVIFIFTLLVSYDTHRMIQLKNMCTSLPNYPKFSTDFFLDILNLFKRIAFLGGTK